MSIFYWEIGIDKVTYSNTILIMKCFIHTEDNILGTYVLTT